MGWRGPGGRVGFHLVLGDPKHFLHGRDALYHLAQAILANARAVFARVALELVLARAVVNHSAHFLIYGDELVYACTSFVAALALSRVVDLGRVARVYTENIAFVFARLVGYACRRIENAHETLSEDTDNARRQQERLHAHIPQSSDRTDSRVRVQRG